MEIKTKLIELFYFIFMKYGSESGTKFNYVCCMACNNAIKQLVQCVAGSELSRRQKGRLGDGYKEWHNNSNEKKMIAMKMPSWFSNQQSTQLNWILAFTRIKCKKIIVDCPSTCQHYVQAQNIMVFHMRYAKQWWWPLWCTVCINMEKRSKEIVPFFLFGPMFANSCINQVKSFRIHSKSSKRCNKL